LKRMSQKQNDRKSKLKRRYNITPEQYDIMFEEQAGVCAICGMPEHLKRGSTIMNLCVDHMEDELGVKYVRGLICSSCNRALGKLGDTTAALKKAYEYTKRIRFINGEEPK